MCSLRRGRELGKTMTTRIVIQRVSVHWTSRNRGARAAVLRRNPSSKSPPPTDRGDLLHGIAMWDHAGYRPQESLRGWDPHTQPWGLLLHASDGRLSVSRTSVSDGAPGAVHASCSSWSPARWARTGPTSDSRNRVTSRGGGTPTGSFAWATGSARGGPHPFARWTTGSPSTATEQTTPP